MVVIIAIRFVRYQVVGLGGAYGVCRKLHSILNLTIASNTYTNIIRVIVHGRQLFLSFPHRQRRCPSAPAKQPQKQRYTRFTSVIKKCLAACQSTAINQLLGLLCPSPPPALHSRDLHHESDTRIYSRRYEHVLAWFIAVCCCQRLV
jgi:hypothetical protein